jgi:hypothetical protein
LTHQRPTPTTHEIRDWGFESQTAEGIEEKTTRNGQDSQEVKPMNHHHKVILQNTKKGVEETRLSRGKGLEETKR